MRLLNKLVVGASSVAFAAALVAGVNAPTASASSVKDKVIVDLDNQMLAVSSSGDKKISVSFPSVKGTEITGEKNVCTYDMPKSGSVAVDLSTLNVTKDNYIKVWGDKNTEPVIYKIPAADKLGKASIAFKAATKDQPETATATIPKKGESTAYKGKIQVAVGTGSWHLVESTGAQGGKSTYEGLIDVSDFTALGATLRVRVAGADAYTGPSPEPVETTSKEYTIKGSTKKATVVEYKGSFPSKEIKVKVPKKAAAPKVKVDYTKGIVTLPKNAEYRVNTANSLGEWKDGTSLTTKENSEFDISKGGAFDVRTKAKDKKPASMYLAFKYDAQAVLKVANDGNVKDDAAKVKVTSGSATSADLTLTYARTVTTGKKASTSGAITISNANKDFAYEYLVVKDGGNEDPKADVKGAKAVKSGKDTVVKFKNDAKYTVYVRRAAVTKGDVAWATKWVKAIELSKTDLKATVTEIK